MNPIAATYDYRLVTLSFLISILTSYAALDLAGRVKANRGNARIAWLLGGGFAMGSGIWCMHYTGMLAFRLPMPVYYHIPTVILSLLAAIIASSIAFYVVSRDPMKPIHIVLGSVLMGTAIAAMHYTGMAAMRLRAMHHYNLELWVWSVVLAVVISLVGLLLIFYSRDGNRDWKLKSAIALTIGLAIPVMHYTGMAAVSFTPMVMSPDLSWSTDISSLASSAILVVTCIILGFALLTSMVDRRTFLQHSILESERKMLRILIDNIPDFMYVKDVESRFVVANRLLASWMGVDSPEDLIGKNDFDLFPRELADGFYEDEQQVMRSGQPLFNREEITIDSKGNEMSILTTKVPLHNDKGEVTGIAGVGRNISERKKSEDALREAERRYRGLFDEAIVGIFQVSQMGIFLSVNPALATICGYSSPQEMLSSVTSQQLFVDLKRREEYEATVTRLGSLRNFECEIFRKDGSKVWVSTSARAIFKDGALVRLEGMTEDVTERKLLRDQLFQAQKLESVGQLAAGIAHEINTPTQYIGDNVRFLKDSFQDVISLLGSYEKLLVAATANTLTSETVLEVTAAVERADTAYLVQEIPRAIDQTLEGITRVSTLVSAMKEFSHPGTKEKIPLDLNHSIESTITVARNEWKYVANLETDFDPLLPLVSCLPGEFNQVILNLIVNAAHAIADVVANGGPDKGIIKVMTRNCPACVEIRIQDTGGGIPENVQARVFDPFFTTKEIGKGTGQGLAIARSVVVDKHGGSIDFETEAGTGTTFVIRLPHDVKTSASTAAAA
jgi:PAS domain S-box-containing protein